MDCKYWLAITLVLGATLSLGCAAKSELTTSVDCVSPNLVTATLQTTGLPTSTAQSQTFTGVGSVLRLTTPSCTGVWLGLDAGPIRLALLGDGQLPSAVDAAVPATPSTCLPAGVGSPVTIPGYTTVAGTVLVSVVPGALVGAVLRLTSTDLVVEDPVSHLHHKVTFAVNASFPYHCATLIMGTLSAPSSWGIGAPPAGGVSAAGSCGTAHLAWQGVATPATPPFVCAVPAGTGFPVADAVTGYDGVGDGL